MLNLHSRSLSHNKKQVIEDRLLNQVTILTIPVDYYSLPASNDDNVC